MPGGRLLRAAATASMVSSARMNRANRKALEQQMASNNQVNSASAPSSDLTAQLEELNNLKNQGLITQEEFDAKKKQLLGL